MPLHGGCSSARGPHVAGGPGDLWQTQPHPLLHESPCSEVQLPGPGSCFPLKVRDTEDGSKYFVLYSSRDKEEKSEDKG